MKLHHLGIATKNIKKSKEFVLSTHTAISEIGPVWDPNLKANLLMIQIVEGLSIELVSGPAVESILKKGISLYHYCYEVEDINDKINEFQKAGGLLIVKPTPAVLFDGRLVSFIFTPIGLIELLNRK
ncbi:VOC family protein [Prochlorococcus sp. MIT 1011]|uniref:VOC family protein n=1 Tax=Prochlorococcus sp. MIT 1011 TaxID=3082520 RepID=UPI0039B38301